MNGNEEFVQFALRKMNHEGESVPPRSRSYGISDTITNDQSINQDPVLFAS